jgi:ActR/RegA family two-component response regulator
MTQATILLADADRIFVNRLKKCLEAAGHHVISVAKADETFAKCKEHHPAIALIDGGTAVPQWIDLVGYIHSYCPKTTTVVLTSSGTVAQAVAAMKLGVADYMEKPVDPEAVELLCREILMRQKVAGAGTVDEYLELAALASSRNARIETRQYLKSAMLRDLTRPEPYCRLAELYESEGNLVQAVRYYFSALDTESSFEAARSALARLGHAAQETASEPRPAVRRQPASV